MHLDAGVLEQAETEARRAIELDRTGLVEAAALRTLVDIQVSRGEFAEAGETAQRIHSMPSASVESFIPLSVRTLMARIALEQGRSVEAASAARAAVREAEQQAESRMALLAEVVLRQIEPDTPASPTSTARACPGRCACPCSPRTPATTSWPATSPGPPASRPTWSCSPTAAGWVATPSTGD